MVDTSNPLEKSLMVQLWEARAEIRLLRREIEDMKRREEMQNETVVDGGPDTEWIHNLGDEF